MRYLILSFLMLVSANLLLAQKDINNPDPKKHIAAYCTALESYKVDENGYPELLESLFPGYVKEKPEAFLASLSYEVKKDDSMMGANDIVYKRFTLTYFGPDKKKGTEDDVIIDTHKVIKQPKGFGLKEMVIYPDLPSLSE